VKSIVSGTGLYSVVVFLELSRLGKVSISSFGQGTVLKGVVVSVVGGEGVNLHFAHFSLHKVLESAVLLAGLALNPIFNLSKAHAGRHLFSLDALHHSLVKRVARMGYESDGVEGFHYLF
jgi:hypothetical protein